ncbi:MAG: aminotransferase class III-fold pyridoxal phosphate-dependent enzyme [Chloroflexi bacterium]|nr:aminotransferase class III-fold pyridoxal phosphate-dependent enzyme [Chloroflexota bacterium]
MNEKGKASTQPAVHRTWRPMPTAERAEGIYLYDTDGKRYIDGAAGSSVVVTIGHGVQSVADAMYAQMKKVSFAAPHVFSNQPLQDLGRVVASKAPGSMQDNCRAWFTCTGTDAIDDAMRVARQYFVATGQRSKTLFISRWQGFHGNNLAVTGMHGHTGRRRLYMGMNINSPHIPPAYCYRCPFEMRLPDCRLKCARTLETEIKQQGEENVAGFVAEPVVGAALGAVPAPDGYFQVIREICDKYNVLLIADEVMTAWGRIGHWFGIEAWGVTPDIIATAKGMTSGYTTLAATIAREEIWAAIEKTGVPFLAGHTMDLNPVSCAGALEVIRVVEQQDLVSRSRQVGAYLLDKLNELRTFDIIGDVRGKGLMCGFELVKDKATKEPFPPANKASLRFQDEAMRRGLVLFQCTGCVEGTAGDMVLVTPPLIITQEQVDEMSAILKETTRVVQHELLG